MNAVFVVGRIALVLVFVLSGAMKLMDISTYAAMIDAKIKIPAAIADLTTQLQTMTALTLPQLMAITVGVVEVLAGLMIAANLGARIAAIVLILFTLVATFYFHDFWNMVDAERANNMTHALKNLSIIGGLLVLFVIGSGRAIVDDDIHEMPRL